MKRPFSFARVTRIPQSMMFMLLAPILLVQARRTARNTPRLDPATGAETGVTKVGGTNPKPAFRLLVIGESTAAGVGASDHAEALPGFLADALRKHLRRSVAWSVTGKNGATVRRVITDLVPSSNGFTSNVYAADGHTFNGLTFTGHAFNGHTANGHTANGHTANGHTANGHTANGYAANGHGPDLVVVTVGINDLIRRRPLERWAADLAELITALRARYLNASVLVAGMPPVHRFPAIPQPLRMVLGAQARAMDKIMREVAHAHGAFHVPMDEAMARDRRLFASDGFHPSPAGYRVWAHDLAQAISSPASYPPWPPPRPAYTVQSAL
ncbi:SGNH/GDSL hydrolase family protein [Spirillospora sp. NPDC048911]|uniref:SGNH/GDSL hydrolase family protein n=1 Tax=Spirillospora sp. NPDC048911 TaxID=3364527 RepID=UPI003720745E